MLGPACHEKTQGVSCQTRTATYVGSTSITAAVRARRQTLPVLSVAEKKAAAYGCMTTWPCQEFGVQVTYNVADAILSPTVSDNHTCRSPLFDGLATRLEQYSQELKRAYFINLETSESTWERPADLSWRRISVEDE
eukprot:353460-Chlamydomonas_euryale.AAC.13